MTREKIFQVLAVLGIGAAIAIGTGCTGPGYNGNGGGGGNPTPTPPIPAGIYYVNTGENPNRVTAQNSAPVAGGGIPSSLPGSPFSTGQNGAAGAPFGIALAKGGTVLYVVNSSMNNVTAFAVAGDATLSTIATTSVTGGTNPSGICVNPASTLAAVVDTSGAVDTFTIGAGALVNAHTIGGLNTPVTCAFSQDGTHGYVTGAVGIYGFNIDAGGTLTTITGSPFNAVTAYQGIATTSTAAFAASQTASGLGVFLIQADGSLQFQQLLPTAAAPIGLALTPSGNAVYVACAAARSVDGFSINGVTLNRLGGAPYPTQANQSAYLSVSSAGNLLVVLSKIDLAVTLFAIKSDGSLGFAPANLYGIGVPAGANPAAVVAR
jgi:6-phosphogluconolactonase (cycloisomerase 2 family)